MTDERSFKVRIQSTDRYYRVEVGDVIVGAVRYEEGGEQPWHAIIGNHSLGLWPTLDQAAEAVANESRASEQAST
jgi:hypothetical protein